MMNCHTRHVHDGRSLYTPPLAGQRPLQSGKLMPPSASGTSSTTQARPPSYSKLFLDSRLRSTIVWPCTTSKRRWASSSLAPLGAQAHPE